MEVDETSSTPTKASESTNPPTEPKTMRKTTENNGAPSAPKQMRTNTDSTKADKSTTVIEPTPKPAIKPFYKVCYGCHSPDHLIADCYRTSSVPRSDISFIMKFQGC